MSPDRWNPALVPSSLLGAALLASNGSVVAENAPERTCLSINDPTSVCVWTRNAYTVTCRTTRNLANFVWRPNVSLSGNCHSANRSHMRRRSPCRASVFVFDGCRFCSVYRCVEWRVAHHDGSRWSLIVVVVFGDVE